MADRRGSLTANTVAVVTMADTTANPTVAGTGNGIFMLPAAVASRTHRRPAREARTIVKLISAGTPGYDVQGLNPKAVTE